MAGGIKVTEAKAAAVRLQDWVDNCQDPLTYAGDLGLVLRHYAQLTRKKVSAKGRYQKGRGYEYELRDHFTASGLKCRRVMQSGGGVEKDDLVLTTGWGEEYRLEAKRVSKLPAYLDNPQCHATLFRRDRGDTFVLLTLDRFTEMAQ
jgi:hypothetical protein